MGRGGHRLRRPPRRCFARRGGADRSRPRPSRRLQGAEIGALHRGHSPEPGWQAAAPGLAGAFLGRPGAADMSVHVEKDGAVTTVTIDRPEVRNAVDPDTADALRAAFDTFEADETAHVAVLTGAGGHFCAGYDLKAFDAHGTDLDPTGE